MQPSTIGFTEDCAGGGATSLACVEHVSGRFRCIGGNETNAQNAAFMDKIRKDYEKIVSEALDA